MASSSPSGAQGADPRGRSLKRLGPFALIRLLGKSERTMAWQVHDPRRGQDLVLVLPRRQPAGVEEQERWAQPVRRAARLDHPNLARALEVGVHEGWPYVAYELGDGATLVDRIGHQAMGAEELAGIAIQLLQALAFAHDAGLAHRDVEPFLVLVGDRNAVRVLGLEVGVAGVSHAPGAAVDPAALRAQRDAAEGDVLQVGFVLHQALIGQPALDEPDAGRAAARLPPQGRDMVRLPWAVPRPIPDTLRVIVNRCTDRQPRQRYRNARTLARALEGWLKVENDSTSGPLALLIDRLHAVGVLPAGPGAADRVARMALMERERTIELAQVVLEDTALAFEMLRAVNTAQLRSGQVSGNGPVLTIRRAIAMIGLEGVRRCALTLRDWPGPLNEAQADELSRLVRSARRASRVALFVRPPGYDPEVVYLVTMLQNLGRLVVQYHFADEAQQIRRLMESGGSAEERGMDEASAALAVLGVEIEAIAVAVARWWGMDDSVVHMMRRLPLATPVRQPETDDETLRAVASCANEAIDALALRGTRAQQALQRVVQRYGRALNLTADDLKTALQQRSGTVADILEAADATPRGGAPHAEPETLT